LCNLIINLHHFPLRNEHDGGRNSWRDVPEERGRLLPPEVQRTQRAIGRQVLSTLQGEENDCDKMAIPRISPLNCEQVQKPIRKLTLLFTFHVALESFVWRSRKKFGALRFPANLESKARNSRRATYPVVFRRTDKREKEELQFRRQIESIS